MKTVTRTEYYDFIKLIRRCYPVGVSIRRSITYRFDSEHIVEKIFLLDNFVGQAVLHQEYESYVIDEDQ